MMKNLMRAGVPSKIPTTQFPNTGVEHYSYASLLGYVRVTNLISWLPSPRIGLQHYQGRGEEHQYDRISSHNREE